MLQWIFDCKYTQTLTTHNSLETSDGLACECVYARDCVCMCFCGYKLTLDDGFIRKLEKHGVVFHVINIPLYRVIQFQRVCWS